MTRKMKRFTKPSLPPPDYPSEHVSRRPRASLRTCARVGGARACVCVPERAPPSLPSAGQPAQWLSACVSLQPGRAPAACSCAETSRWLAHRVCRELKLSSRNLLYLLYSSFQEKEVLYKMKSIPVTTRNGRFSLNLNFVWNEKSESQLHYDKHTPLPPEYFFPASWLN